MDTLKRRPSRAALKYGFIFALLLASALMCLSALSVQASLNELQGGDTPITGLVANNSSPTPLGSATAFTATITSGTNVSYTWSFGDGTTGLGVTTTHTYASVGSYTATLTATNSVSVVVTTTPVSIIDTPITGLNANNSSPTALGSATAFTATITGGSNVTYQWNFGDGTTGSGVMTTRTYASVGNYTARVTATNSLGSVVATTPVTITDAPITGLSASNSSPTAIGGSTAFSATITSGSNVTYQWNFGDGVTGSGANVSHPYATLGSYTARLTATNSLGSVIATTPVTITDTPITGLSASNSSPTRLGSATAFTATITGGTNVNYAWNFGDGSLGSGANASHVYLAVGNYTARVTATNSLGSVVTTTPVTITDTPIIGLSASNSSPTPLSSATAFTVTITGGSNVTYQWNFGDGSLGSGANASHVYLAVGNYTARVTATNGISLVVGTTAVSIIDRPITGLSASNSSPTELGSATAFTVTITGGSNASYQWNFGDGSLSSGANVSHVYPAVGNYTARITATNGVGVIVHTTTVNIIDRPITGLSASNSSPTELGSATALTATITDGSNVSYQWDFGDGSTDAGATATHTYAAIGDYTATVTAINGVSVVVATTSVSIIDIPISELSASNSSPTRLGSPTALTATITSGSNVNYAWNFGDGAIASGANTSRVYAAIGNYTARVTATNGVNAVIATTAVSIIDRPIMGLSAINSSPTPLGSSTSFIASITDGSNVTYQWNFGDGATDSGANTTHTYATLGNFTARVTATNGVSVVVATTPVSIYQVIFYAYLPMMTRDYAPSGPCGIPQATWQGGAPNGVVVDALLVGPKRDGRVIYAGAATAPGLYVSRDRGATWPELYSLPPVLSFVANPVVTTTIYAGTFGGGLYHSLNEGANWSPIATPKSFVWSLAAVQTSPASFVLYAGTDTGIYYTASPGSGWTAATGSISGKVVYAIVVDPENGEMFAATSGNGVHKSTDGGVSWNPTALRGISVFALAVGPSRKLYAGVNGQGVFGSTNGGLSWTPLNAGLSSLSVYTLALDPLNPQKLFAGTTGGGVFISTNGAGAWTAYNTGLSQTNVYALALNPTCYGTLLAGSDYGVWRTDTRSTAVVSSQWPLSGMIE